KLIADFRPTGEWVLEPGDMLYLPPRYAHEGTAIGECTTYSIGFRAPQARELGAGFLGWLAERVDLPGMYADPDLTLQDNSAQIGDAMVDRVTEMLNTIRWSREDVAAFLGDYLSEPKPTVFFVPPDEPLNRQDFATAVTEHGFMLDPATLLLFRDGRFHLNGERLDIGTADPALL